MPNIHQLNCATNVRNVGFSGCVLDWKLIKGAFIWDNPQTFTAAQLSNLQTTLQGLAWTDIKSNRCYPVHNFVNPEDATEAPTIQTFSDGSKAKVRDGVYDWSFQFTQGGFALLKALATHASNGNTYVLFYDKDYKILGYNNAGLFATIPLQIFDALPWKMNSGSAVAEYKIHFVFPANYANKDAEVVVANFPLTQISGLKDIRMQLNSFNQTTGVANITLENETDGSNLYPIYGAAFVAALFIANNDITGSEIQITTVVGVAGSQTYNVTINPADANYPHSGLIDLGLSAPSALNTHGIPGYDSETLQLQVIGS